MKLLTNMIGLLLALAFLAAIGWGAYTVIIYVNKQYQVIDQPMAAIITIGAVILVLCAWIIAGAIRSAGSNGDKRINPEKALIYAHFMENWPNEDHFKSQYSLFLDDLKELKKPLALWGSDKVLRQFNKLYELAKSNGSEELVWKEINKLLLVIRKDIGLENLTISNIDFKVFLSDSEIREAPTEEDFSNELQE